MYVLSLLALVPPPLELNSIDLLYVLIKYICLNRHDSVSATTYWIVSARTHMIVLASAHKIVLVPQPTRK